jgi:NAD(P)-dependent dehydrogenase (short-subunit alcohol dehydrogenase family)
MDPDSSWTAFEVHAKGSILVAQAFSRTKNQKASFVVDTSSIVIAVPPWPASAAYTASKMAATKIWDFYRVENPSTRVVSMQPGQILTDNAKKIYAGFKDLDHGE